MPYLGLLAQLVGREHPLDGTIGLLSAEPSIAGKVGNPARGQLRNDGVFQLPAGEHARVVVAHAQANQGPQVGPVLHGEGGRLTLLKA